MHIHFQRFARIVLVFALLCTTPAWLPTATQAATSAAVTPTLSAYLLSNNSLIALNEALVSKPVAPRPITAATPLDPIVAIDMRPQTGGLYGLSYNAASGVVQLLHISPISGLAVPVGTTGSFVDGAGNPVRIGVDATTQFGMDFNPTVDRLRIVTSNGQNFRINPNTGAFIDGNLGGPAGSVTGVNPDGSVNGATTTVDATAYTNNEPNVTITTQYTLDATTDQLLIQSPPNSGTQTAAPPITLNGNPLDFTSVTGFDIPPGVNAVNSNQPATGNGYATLTVGGTAGLYRIDLATGAATLVGGLSGPIQGLALWTPIPAGLVLDPGTSALVRFRLDSLGTVTTTTLTGVTVGETIAAVDYRPATGQAYALGINPASDTATLYLLDPQSGALTVVGGAGSIAYVDAGGAPIDLPDPAAVGYGMDFNPTVDRLRVVTDTGLNFRLNPITGAPVDGNLNQTSSPPAGTNPDGFINGLPAGSTGVDATTYTNNYNGTTVTTQYTLDSASNQLFIQSPPNSGTQISAIPVTLNGAPLDFTGVNGFDTPPGTATNSSNTPAIGASYAVLTAGGNTDLYRVNLATAAATNLGPIGTGSAANSLMMWTAPLSASLVASSTTIPEAAGAVTVTVTSTGGAPLIVSYTTAPGSAASPSDFTTMSNTVVLTSTTLAHSFSIPIINDTADEPNETLTVQLNGPNDVPTSITLTIVDDDLPLTPQPFYLSAYLLSNNSLIAVDEALVSKPATPRPITAATPLDPIVAIDMRPQTGGLYGLSYNAISGTLQLLHISPISGLAVPVGTTGSFVDGAGNPVRIGVDTTTQFGMDFNPTVDRLRIVTSNGQNFRINPNTGAFIDGDLGGAAGSVAGVNPDGSVNGATTSVDATAYTNNEPNVTVTTQYTLDVTSNQLLIQTPPNSGTQTAALAITRNGSPLDFTSVTGFDIPPGVNTATSNQPVLGNGYATLTVGGTAGLYRIDLATGAATLVGGLSGTIQGLALWAPTPAGLVLNTASVPPSLSRFRLSSPGTTTNVNLATVSIVSGETIVAADYRPATGQTYALGINAATNTGTLYLLDPQTGALTVVGAASSIAYVDAGGAPIDLPDPASVGYGMDVNPTVDRLRVVTGSGLNFRLNPITGAPVDGNLNQTSSPPAGVNPDAVVNGLPAGSTGVDATTYTNNFNGTTVTTQYTLDSASNQLFIQSPPNSGTQINALPVTLNGAPLDFAGINGFDTPTGTAASTSNAPAIGDSYAALRVGNSTNLYRVNLTTGAATGLGPIGTGITRTGLVMWTAPFSATLAASSTTVPEAAGAVTLTVTSTGGAPLIVSYTTAPGSATSPSDFTAISTTVVLTSTAVAHSFSIPIINDTTDEPNETLTVQLNGPSGIPASITLTIVDDDLPPPQKFYLPIILNNGATTDADQRSQIWKQRPFAFVRW
jgi:hypothetical protein